MIKLQQYTPEVYYKESRDFQFLGRTFDVVLNYVKSNIDTIYNNPFSDLSDEYLTDLLATTLGFKQRHNYNAKSLKAICSIFPTVMRIKGTKKAIEMAALALVNSSGLDLSEAKNVEVNVEDNDVKIFIPIAVKDITLLHDILEYILPAGLGCTIIQQTKIAEETTSEHVVFQNIKVIYGATTAYTSIVPESGVNIDFESGVIQGTIVNSYIVGNNTKSGYEKLYPQS